MFSSLKKGLDLQIKINQIKKELETARVEGRSDDGQVRIVMDGKQTVHSIEIEDSLIDIKAKEKLKTGIVTCLGDAIKKSQNLATEKIKSSTGINLPLK